MIELTEKDGALLFNVRVAPKASKSEIVGEFGGALKVRIAAAPVEGAANAELIKILAKTFAVSKSDVEITSGLSSKNKTVKISNLSAEKFHKIIV